MNMLTAPIACMIALVVGMLACLAIGTLNLQIKLYLPNWIIPTAMRVLVVVCLNILASAQSAATPSKETWSAINVSFELSERSRITAVAENHGGEDAGYGQAKIGALFSYRMRRVGPHLRGDQDKENEYNLVLGAGYEFLQTDQNEGTKRENRIIIQAVPKYVLFAKILMQDRNRIEFRWVGGKYDFRYRNKLIIDRPFKLGKLRMSPYASGEWFWDRKYHSWNQNQVALGVQWPYKKILMLDTYYKRQNCTTCSRDPLDILGVTINFYVHWPDHK